MLEGGNAVDEIEARFVEVFRQLMDVADDVDVLAFDDVQSDVFPVIPETALVDVARPGAGADLEDSALPDAGSPPR